MRFLTVLPFFFLVSCSALQPSWNGFYLGVQQIGSFHQTPTEDLAGLYGTAIVNVGKDNSIQFEVIQPLNGRGDRGWRLAVDRRLF